MSLKAYDGMMTMKGFGYLHEKIKENLPLFEAASKKALAKAYADVIVDTVDNIHSKSILRTLDIKVHEPKLVKELDSIDKNTTLISYLFQGAKILSKGYLVNPFCVQLNISFEPSKNNKKRLLLYPNILVNEHRDILLTFLDNWYAQNQTDRDEKISSREWKQRTKDWWGFNEVKGLSSKITLFDPNDYWNNLVDFFRGEELIQGIIDNVRSDESRQKDIAIDMILKKETDGLNADERMSRIMNRVCELKTKDLPYLKQFIVDNSIEPTVIDEKFLNSTLEECGVI